MATDPNTKRRFPIRSFLFGTVLGILAALVGITVWAVAKADRLPTLTQVDFDAAVRRWNERGPKAYQMDIRLGGRQPGVVHAEVRDGTVTAMTLNGIQPREPRTWDPWSVDALLQVIADELAAAADPAIAAKKFGVPAGTTVLQGAIFDPQYGYPRRYRRSVLGTPLELSWEVTRFEPTE